MNENQLKNAKLYALRSRNTDRVYIGSTTLELKDRLMYHISHYKIWKNRQYHYVSSYVILEAGDVYIEELRSYADYVAKKDLHHDEGLLIKATPNCVNKTIAGRTKQEYYNDNKTRFKLIMRTYYLNNRERLIKKAKDYYYANREAICERRRLKTIRQTADDL